MAGGASSVWLGTLATNAAILLCGLATGVLSARLLAPEGRGALAAVLFWPHLFTSLAHRSVRRRPRSSGAPSRTATLRGSLRPPPGSPSVSLRSAAVWAGSPCRSRCAVPAARRSPSSICSRSCRSTSRPRPARARSGRHALLPLQCGPPPSPSIYLIGSLVLYFPKPRAWRRWSGRAGPAPRRHGPPVRGAAPRLRARPTLSEVRRLLRSAPACTSPRSWRFCSPPPTVRRRYLLGRPEPRPSTSWL